MNEVLIKKEYFNRTPEFALPNSRELIVSRKSQYFLFVGKNSAPFCSKIVRFRFSGFSFSTLKKAYDWMMHQVLNNQDLPYAILCDDEIPNEDIFEMIKIIKSNNYLNSIPLILIASGKTIHLRKKALQARVDDYYPDNVDLDDLIHRISFIISINGKKFNAKGKAQKSYMQQAELWLFKRPFDILFASILFLSLIPLFAVIAVMIKLDSKGPVFYNAKRAGSGYRVFDFYKFRTMKVDADKELNKLSHLNQYSSDNRSKDSLFVKIQDDPRVTPLGQFLRKTSLDELPQLLNVIKGDMSIVGNRPLPLYEATKLTTDEWAQRFLAPAGITGLWQVTKRGQKEMSEEERIRLDCSYASNNSFLSDLKIIFLTIPALMQKENV